MLNKSMLLIKCISVLLVMIMTVACSGMQSFATGDLIFHSGFEPETAGVPRVNDPGSISTITGTDNSFLNNSDWDAFKADTRIGGFIIQHEALDNAHQRYANIIDDPTNMLFEDSFDDAYAIGDAPHQVISDMGKRNWTSYTTPDTAMTVEADPNNSVNQVMKVLSTKATLSYPKMDKIVDASSSQRIIIQYKIMNLSRNTYIDITLPTVSGEPHKNQAIKIQGSTATVGSLTKSVVPTEWTNVLLDIDLRNNIYSATVNGDTFATEQILFDTVQTDFTNVKVRFNSGLYSQQFYYLDDIKIKLTDIKFADNFNQGYSEGDAPHTVTGDKGRSFWSAYTTNECSITAQADPLDSSNMAMRVLSTMPTTNYPKLDKLIDVSQAPRFTINYKVINLRHSTYVDLQMPTIPGSPNKTLVRVNGATAYVDANSVAINPDGWTDVSIECDLYNNTYNVFVNGTLLVRNVSLFAVPQKDLRSVKVRFNSALSQNYYYYLDDINIVNAANKVFKYYAGKVINDSKMRVQSAIGGGYQYDSLPEVYFKQRMYLGDGFETLKTAGQNVTSYWLTLAEFMDGVNGDKRPNTNYCSRITMGIDEPAGAGNPLKFYVDYQLADDAGVWEYPYVWEYTSTVDVPIGKWATMEIYLKQGVGTDPLNGGGQFQVYMTLEDGVRQTVFDINNTTYDNGFGRNGYENIQPMKLYGTKQIFNNINNANNDIKIYWDDFETWNEKP